MPKLAVLADDFTGALDTGVQFAKVGIPTLVTMMTSLPIDDVPDDTGVLVLDMETRHLSAIEARRLAIEGVERLKAVGAEYFYKKTDSALRGNIGAELDAMCASCAGETLFFIPAFPKAGRTTVDGRHYCDGVPISRTVFGKDPFNPVIEDYVPSIIASQSSVKVATVSQRQLATVAWQPHGGERILVFDATSDDDMRSIAAKLAERGTPRLMAGCAGMAEYLPGMLELRRNARRNIFFSQPGLIIVSGSLNKMTFEQIEYAREQGFVVVELTPEQKLCADLAKSNFRRPLLEKIREQSRAGARMIIHAVSGSEGIRQTDELARSLGLSAEETRVRVAANLGGLIGMLIEEGVGGSFAVFGGDTLVSVMRAIGGRGIVPICEIESGVVLSTLAFKNGEMSLITKSGGLGSKEIIIRIEEFVNKSLKHKSLNNKGEGKIYA